MRLRFISFVLVVSFTQLFAQNEKTVEKAYIQVISDGQSTAPEFIVVTVKNVRNGQVKELCADITSLFWSIEQELNEFHDKKITKYLLSKSSSRFFDFKDTAALKRLNFYNYHLKNFREINSLIIKKHLVDSLRKLVAYRHILHKAFDDYYLKRRDILNAINDSIETQRPISDEETKMINDLHDQYYDDYYSDSKYDNLREMSSNGKALINIWNVKIQKDKAHFLKITAESNRMYYKFFQQYYKIYGISFCHVAFKYGVITYIGDENPIVCFGAVI